MPNLTELADRCGSDKGTANSNAPHRYTALYDLLFHARRHQPIGFLEIGLCRGGPELGGPVDRAASSPSVAMWKSYFTRAEIFGFDISDFSHQEDARFRFIRGDAGSEADLQRLAAARPQFDIILDDASHASYHQQLTLRCLWDRLAPGGLYIVEDLHWQPAHMEAALPTVPQTASLLTNLFEGDASLGSAAWPEGFAARLRRETQCASFFPGFQPRAATGLKLAVLLKRRPGDEASEVATKAEAADGRASA